MQNRLVTLKKIIPCVLGNALLMGYAFAAAPVAPPLARSANPAKTSKLPVSKPTVAPSITAPSSTIQLIAAPTQTAQGTPQKTTIDMLRSIPFEINGYASGRALPAQFTATNQAIDALNSTPVLLVHMEVLRRAFWELPTAEQDKFLEAIHKRRLINEKDLMLGFDHGYAQLVFKHNKTGLFFLRKANDAMQNQFSALAYGLAEVEADLNWENSPPDAMTTRKLDAMFQLGDAVQRDAKSHQPGFWPSYLRVVDKMKPLGAYRGFSHRDFSLAYVPYGNSVVGLKEAIVTSNLALKNDANASLTSVPLGNICSPTEAEDQADNPASKSITTTLGTTAATASAQQPANFNGNNVLIQFFPYINQSDHYLVKVTNAKGQVMAQFEATTIPRRAVEDLDNDGVYELVIRQYDKNPLKPVIVYRYTPCGLEIDDTVQNKFQ